MTTEPEIRELGRRWTDAEHRGDVAALESMSTDDFTLVGPHGYVLTRDQWLAGFRSGALAIDALTWEDVQVRDYTDAAVAIGVRTQEGTYEQHPAGGRFRGTYIATRHDGRWLLAGVHLSAMAGPPPE